MLLRVKAKEGMFDGQFGTHPTMDYLAAGRQTIRAHQERRQAYQIHDQLYAGRPSSDFINAYLLTPQVLLIGTDLVIPYTAIQTPESLAANIASATGKLYV